MVVSNAKRVKVSGRKDDQILYLKHTMYPGCLKEIKYKDMMRRKPDEVFYSVPGVMKITKAHLILCFVV